MKDDKYVLMNMNEPRSKKIAEALGNKTCKKILDYLADNSEKSEEDISKVLNIKLNTTEYNLKKLLDAGLIEKNKNFFWSKKGKKIALYSLAKKHIIISPSSMKVSPSALRGILSGLLAVLVVALIAFSTIDNNQIEVKDNLNKFNSFEELKKFLDENNLGEGGYFGRGMGGIALMAESTFDGSGANAPDYSTTNIQVEGVDEADIIKSDGKYFYVVNGNKVLVVDAYPTDELEILSEIEFGDKETLGELFINKNKLIIFTNEYVQENYIMEERCYQGSCPSNYYGQKTNIYVFDVSNKENPERLEVFGVSGSYVSSRMIGDYVYLVANEYIYDEVILPMIEVGENKRIIDAGEISYMPVKGNSFQYTILLSINVKNLELNEETLLSSSSQNIYVSEDNIYTTYTEYGWWHGELDKDSENTEKTIINKFSIDEEKIKYVASGEVPGHILNQFSMDEFEGNFRIATTVPPLFGAGGIVADENIKQSKNNIYVLDKSMNVVGSLEDLAPGETIYSARFMGERAYLVTFRKVDPLFVIDLSNPEAPNVLGKLKIPGYSDYLHPIDEDHIIGIGKETAEAKEGDFVWYQGMKMAVFDVSDVENPVQLHEVVIGDRGTDSEALHNHKAFLYDKEKELLVLPIILAEFKNEPTNSWEIGEYTFQGAYVYNLNLEDGFNLKGRITHYTDEDVKKMGYYFYGDKSVTRSTYIGNVLYTFSNKFIKANELENLDEVGEVELPFEGYGRYGVEESFILG